MPVSASFIQALKDVGVTDSQIVAALLKDEDDSPPKRSSAAERQERYRRNKAAQTVAGDVTRHSPSPSPSKEKSPTPPKETQPLPQPLDNPTELFPEQKSNGKTYAFEHGVVRLLKKDLDQWRSAFPHVSVEAELLAKEPWLAKQPSWFNAAAGWLAKLERQAHNPTGPPATPRRFDAYGQDIS